jgi:hypothetical protein
MAIEKHLSTPTAILIAGVLIAGALFFGLRGRDTAPLPAAPGPPPSSGPLGAAPPPLPLPAPAALPERSAVLADALKALEAHRAAVVEKCLKPNGATRSKFFFNITFDAAGKQIARGFIEDRATARPGVGPCLSDTVPALEVPPRGAIVQVDGEWTLP